MSNYTNGFFDVIQDITAGDVLAMLVALMFAMVIYLAFWAVQSIAIYMVVKKANRPNPWLIWLSVIPLVGAVIKWYVLADIPGEKSYELFGGRIKLEKRFYAVVAWAVIAVAGSILAGLVNVFLTLLQDIPLIGMLSEMVSAVIGYIPAVAMGIVEYGLIRDILNMFKADKKENITVAICITAADKLFANGLALAILLFTLTKNNILPETSQSQEPLIVEAVVTDAEDDETKAE